MAYVERVYKDFGECLEQPVKVQPVKLKAVEPDADTEKFIKFLEREERNFDRMLNRIVGNLEREING